MTKINVRLDKETIKKIQERYDDKKTTDKIKISDAIRACLEDAVNLHALTKGKNCRKISPSKTLVKIKCEKTSDLKLFSFRLDADILEFLKNYYSTTNTTDTIRCAIYDVFNDIGNTLELSLRDYLIPMMGKKNTAMLQFLLPIFDDAKKSYHLVSYLEPFAGTCNVLYHTPTITGQGCRELVNDFSKDLVNLHCVVRKYPAKLKVQLANLIKHSDLKITFENSKILLAETQFPKRSNKEYAIKRAAAFYICRYFSVYSDGKYLKEDKSIKNCIANLDMIYIFSKRLENVEIKKGDALYRLDRLKKICDALIYIDAPYINTEKYYGVNSDKPQNVFKSHTALQHRIEKLRLSNVCLISYRITAPNNAQKKNSDAGKKICDKLNQLYKNKNYFYRLKTLKTPNNEEQVEILLSTHKLDGFKAYNLNIEEEL